MTTRAKPPTRTCRRSGDGEKARLLSYDSEQHFTQPPARYTEASLVKALEEKGIGRPSTYAPTISTILQRGYVSREKKRLYPTELGNVVNEIMSKSFPDIVDIQFTADMENRLDDVEAGKTDWKQVVTDFYGPFEKELEAAEAGIEKVKVEDEVSDVPCEKCGAMMVYKMGRFGRFLACRASRNAGTRRRFSSISTRPAPSAAAGCWSAFPARDANSMAASIIPSASSSRGICPRWKSAPNAAGAW